MRLKKLTLTAALTAAALVMFVLESQLPPLTAIPGIKPGLSNIFTLFTMETLGPGWAFGLFFTRVTLGCVITGQGSAFLYSFAGGLCAYALMLLLRRVRFGPLELGDLRRGEWRELSAEEIARLKAL